MQDHTYRMAICWQNVGYNQPPHLGYYLANYKSAGVDDVKADNAGGNFVIYNAVSGVKVCEMKNAGVFDALNGLAAGVYIVVYPDGHREKVLKKSTEA